MSFIAGLHVPTQPKNLAINGNLDFWQRVENLGAGYSTAGVNTYIADMIQINLQGTTTKSCTVQQSSDVPTVAQSGAYSNFSYQYINNSSISFAATDVLVPFQYNMEGEDYAKIHGKVVTFGFWFKASVSGTYSFSISNHDSSRSYPTNFSYSSPNTWQFISITIQMDTLNASWLYGNNRSLCVYVAAIWGSNYTTASANTWGNLTLGTTSTTNWAATSGASIQVSQFSIVEGALGFGAKGFQRAGVDWAHELQLCQRYFEKSFYIGQAPVNGSSGAFGTTGGLSRVPVLPWTGTSAASGAGCYGEVQFMVTKRTYPTVAQFGNNSGVWCYNNASVAGASSGAANFNGNISLGADTNKIVVINNVSQNNLVGVEGHWTADASL